MQLSKVRSLFRASGGQVRELNVLFLLRHPIFVLIASLWGHALFLTYAILRPGSIVTRITAGIVMVEVIYLKYFVWHDFITSTMGIILASLAALLCRVLIARQLIRKQRLAQTV